MVTIMYTDAQYTLLLLIIPKIAQYMFWVSLSATSWRISRSLILPCVDKQFSMECDTDTWTRKHWKRNCSVSCEYPKGWTYQLRTVLLAHLFQAIWTAFKSELSCNDVLTNNTKALVYGRTQEASLVLVQDSGTMGAILGKNTFEFSSRIMHDDRSSERTLISEGTMARGRPHCNPSPPSHCSSVICPMWLVMLRMQRVASNTFSPRSKRERKSNTKVRPAKDSGV